MPKIFDGNLTPEQAIEYFKDKIDIPPDEFYELLNQNKAAAFTVSRVATMDLIADIHSEVIRALEKGETLAEFKARADAIMQLKGYDTLAPWHLETIFRTNLETGFNAGRLEMMEDTEEDFPYWRMDGPWDDRVSEICDQFRPPNDVFPANDPVWSQYYPPNHFNCRRTVVPIHKSRNVKPSTKRQPDNPDPNFNVRPRVDGFKPDFDKYPDKLGKQLKMDLK